MSDYSDYSRDELEAYCRYLEKTVKDKSSAIEQLRELVNQCSEMVTRHMQRLLEIAETDPGDGSKETLRWRVKVVQHRNEVLKEENSELKTRAENAERKAEGVALTEGLKRMHVLQLLGECQRKLTWARNRRAKSVEEPKRTDAQRIAEAVADASHAGTSWDSGNDLLRWLHQWAEECAPSMPHSKSTLKRRLQEAGLWTGSGRSGKASVAGTVERCIAFHEEHR